MVYIKNMQRPVLEVVEFDRAIESADLSNNELAIIEHIRFVGTFTQPSVRKALRLEPKPPVLSLISMACKKIGTRIPMHFRSVREWSESISDDGIRWDGNLICSPAFNIEGIKLCPENGNCQLHLFAVHPELFNGL